MNVAFDNPARAPAPALRQMALGAVFGLDNLSHAIALATLVFAGGMAAGASLGATIFLIAAIVGTGSLLMRPCFVGPVYSNVQNVTVAVLIPLVFVIGTLEIDDEARILKVLILLGSTAILTGVIMLVISVFDLGRFVRLMPYSVTAGYLAASGALLIRSALYLVCAGRDCSPTALLSGQSALPPLPILTVGFAVALWGLVRLSRNFGLVIGIVLGIAGFHLIVQMAGIPVAQIREAGLLPQAGMGTVLWPTELPPISMLDPGLLLANWPVVGAAVLISVFGAMLNMTGAELALRHDIDTRRELARAGLVNICTGTIGSSVTYISGSTTPSAAILGARGRIAPLTTCILLAISAIFIGQIYAVVPTFVSAGLLMFFGAAILDNWILARRHQHRRSDWLLSIAIVAVALTIQMPAAVALGILAASMIFAVSYGRLPVLRSSSDLLSRRSTVDRGLTQSRFLDTHGSDVAVVSLQGFLFFGSVTQLSNHIRTLLERTPPVRTVILDFGRVSRLDGAAILALRKLDILASRKGAKVILCEMNHHVDREVRRGLLTGETSSFERVETCDAALEAAEEQILSDLPPPPIEENALTALHQLTGDPEIARRLIEVMQREEIAANTTLVRSGEQSGDVFLIDSGSLSVYINGKDGRRIRVQKQRPGAVVGEIASYAGTGRTADVEADIEAVIYRMRESRIEQLGRTAPDLAAAWHGAMAAALAEKLRRTNQLLSETAL